MSCHPTPYFLYPCVNPQATCCNLHLKPCLAQAEPTEASGVDEATDACTDGTTRVQDTFQFSWVQPSASGTAPAARAQHTSAIRPIDNSTDVEQLFLFGGTDSRHRLNDL